MLKTNEREVSKHLVAQISGGNTEAEIEMVTRYSQSLLLYLLKTCREENTAYDLYQDTWALVLEKVRNIDIKDPTKLRSFILQIGKNLCIMHYRKQRTTLEFFENSIEIYDEQLNLPESQTEQIKVNNLIKLTIDKLNKERDKELLYRYFLQENDKKDLCEYFKLDTAHFDRVVYRAKQRFKVAWLAN